MNEVLTVDELTFEVRRSERRTTLEIIVDRNGELIVAAPNGISLAELEEFARANRYWVYKKLAEKEALRRPTRTKEYVSGEGFWYLGRSYRLLLVDEQDCPLKLTAGRFRLLKSELDRGREHFIQWYADHARPWLQRRIGEWEPRMGVKATDIDVRDLGYRWGSCGKKDTLYFHWATILLPPSIVEYVAVHELVHLIEPNHTPEFWLRLERAMPDYEQRKQWLAQHGGEYVVL